MKAFTLWLTGLSGSGKTTIADKLAERLREEGKKIVIIDADVIRKEVLPELGYSDEERHKIRQTIANVCHLLTKNGIINIASAIAATKESKDYAIQTANKIYWAYVKCPIKECEERDPQGNYKKFREGVWDNFVGITTPYHEPENPDVVIETDKESVEEGVEKLLHFLKEKVN